ncbi:MAG TPA: phosphatase PAP2 family protein [Polyangiaceae bacterium]|nr:phosphatase PAP2 family protein [Polyangiaceae bacterium]
MHPLDAEWLPRSMPQARTGSLVQKIASHDWILIAYLSALILALLFGRGQGRIACIERVSVDLAALLLVLAIVRLPLLPWGRAASSLLYRSTLLGVLMASFFQLREILPAVTPGADDARIYAFDLRVFGFEPSVWLDRFVSPVTTEWFAFFYFLYFLILAVHILPALFALQDLRVLGQFAVGILLVFTTAHLLYMVVPGWGPYWYLHTTFHNELHGGFFWKLVREAVDAGGAQKDIFPSLHTAGPTYLAIFSFRHRAIAPFKYSWPVIAFFVTQIIIATLFLRWHYLVDVLAGLVLASSAAVIGDRVAVWEIAKRERLGRQPAWMPPAYPWSR